MEIRCPDCCSPDVEPDRKEPAEARRCGNCGASFPRDSGLVTVADAEMEAQPDPQRPVFTFDAELALPSLQNPRITVVGPIKPDSDADEVHELLHSARAVGLIKADRDDCWIYVSPHTLSDPAPVLVVDLGVRQPMLFCCELKLDAEDGEDDLAFTMRLLQVAVDKANVFAAMHQVARSAP
jgi:hypothetical protein